MVQVVIVRILCFNVFGLLMVVGIRMFYLLISHKAMCYKKATMVVVTFIPYMLCQHQEDQTQPIILFMLHSTQAIIATESFQNL